ncbi:MAG: hypothetical protein R3F43_05180 [bacterium]
MDAAPPARIEPATAADVPAIVERWADLLATHAALETALDAALYTPAPHAAATYAAFVRRLLDRRGSVVLVARLPDQPVAATCWAGRATRPHLGGARHRHDLRSGGRAGERRRASAGPSSRRPWRASAGRASATPRSTSPPTTPRPPGSGPASASRRCCTKRTCPWPAIRRAGHEPARVVPHVREPERRVSAPARRRPLPPVLLRGLVHRHRRRHQRP